MSNISAIYVSMTYLRLLSQGYKPKWLEIYFFTQKINFLKNIILDVKTVIFNIFIALKKHNNNFYLL